MFRGVLGQLKTTVYDEEVKLSPIYLLKELLNESIFAGPTPNDSIVLVAQQKADRHNRQISSIYRGPSRVALVHFLPNQPKHGRYAGPADIDIEQANLIFLGEQDGQLRSHCALADSSFPRQHQHFMLHVLELLGNGLDGRVDLDLTTRAKGLVGTALTRLLLPRGGGGHPWAMLIGIVRDLLHEIRNYNFNLVLK